MGFFSKKKTEKKERIKESLSEILKTCSSCGDNSFLAIKTEAVGGIIQPTTNLVGENTGVCLDCGLICHGELYLSRADYSNERLLSLGMLNNSAAFFWLQELFKVSQDGRDHEQAYNDFLAQLKEARGGDIELAKTDWFIGKCIGYYLQNLQNKQS